MLTALRMVSAHSDDLDRYLDLLEEVADWLALRGIKHLNGLPNIQMEPTLLTLCAFMSLRRAADLAH